MTEITPEFLSEHNAKIATFWEEYSPKIKALTDDHLNLIARLVRLNFYAMNELGKKAREENLVPFTWDEKHDLAIGWRMYEEALERLNLYDADFRPDPKESARRRRSHGR